MKDSKELILDDSNDEYIKLNARSKIFAKGQDNFKLDVQAAKSYITNHIEPRLMQFDDLKQRIDYLVANEYYDKQILDKYQFEEITELDDYAKSFNHSFPSFMGALKFFNAYALKTFDGEKYLETYTDRALMNALFLGNGSYQKAKNILKNIMLGRFQPATPTFLNAGKKHRGEYVSCYLLRTEDNMESICRTISTSLQLSKRGGGVAVCLTNLRETGSPIKNIDGLSSGPIPVMKILEDSFTYADQLGQRQGAGAVYISAHHPDIISFLDTKRENADEKIRIKSLSLGVVIPDITFELARENKEMALFSPYDVQKVYGVALSDISITEKYYEMLENPNIKKTFISARKLFLTIAELHFESGYPYLLFEDTVNRRNAHDKKGRIIMSNLCSEIVQVSTPSQYNQDLSFTKIGEDICCNLGSLNIDKMMKAGKEFEEAVDISITALDVVSRNSDLDCAPSIKFGNANNHAVGLGAMNLHGFLATNAIMYDSPEAVDFTNIFFYTLAYNAFKASNRLAKEFGKFNSFDESRFADGSW
ncbi:Ribonucleoside-diphosphate reductase subunit alpha, partial [Mycoplasma putrefaciens]